MLTTTIGEGLAWPVQADGRGSLARLSGLDLLDNNVALLVGIQQGELRWDMRRGTQDLRLLHRRYNGANVRNALARVRTAEVITRYEPRTRAVDATVTQVGDRLRIVTTHAPLGYTQPGRRTVTEV